MLLTPLSPLPLLQESICLQMIIAKKVDLSSLPSPPPQSLGAHYFFPATLVDGYNRSFLAFGTYWHLLLVLVATAMPLNQDSCILWVIIFQIPGLVLLSVLSAFLWILFLRPAAKTHSCYKKALGNSRALTQVSFL